MDSSRRRLQRLFLRPLESHLDDVASGLLAPSGVPGFDFTQPVGESALVGPDSVSWRTFKNPVSLFIGGVAAVILELAEPGVRSGVWQHSSFRNDPVRRLQRTGLAALGTVYGPRSAARRMIAGVVSRHDSIRGTMPGGGAYHANDPDLLDWVQATAIFGFTAAYDRYVQPLGPRDMSRAFAESQVSARLYGATGAPASLDGWSAMLDGMRGRLERSDVVFEFLDIMMDVPALPFAMRPLQRLMVRGAVDMTPGWVRDRLGLTARYGLGAGGGLLLRQAGRVADRIMLESSPAVQSCVRLGLPRDYLYGLRQGTLSPAA